MNEYLAERELWWPVSSKLMAEYNDGSHTHKFSDGTLQWYKNKLPHRDGDKPAIIRATGTLEWYKNGHPHRDGDKPAVIRADGNLHWFKNGVLHRDGDLPACIRVNGAREWYKNGERHRVTGPAVIKPNNKKEYWINGVNITTEVNTWLKTRKYKYPFTPEQQVEFTLTFS
jgi:hypothetical protein